MRGCIMWPRMLLFHVFQPMEHGVFMSGSAPPTTPPTPAAVAQLQPAKKKRTRSSPVARPAFVVVQVLDEAGQPITFDKKRLRIVSVEREAEKVMEATESGNHPNAFYLCVIVPAGTRAGIANKAKSD